MDKNKLAFTRKNFILLGIGFLIWAFAKKIPARAIHPEVPKPKKEATHYAKPLS